MLTTTTTTTTTTTSTTTTILSSNNMIAIFVNINNKNNKIIKYCNLEDDKTLIVVGIHMTVDATPGSLHKG